VEIGEGAPPPPPTAAYTGLFGHVLEDAAARVSIEPVAGRVPLFRRGIAVRVPDARYEPVEVTVVVVITDRAAHAVLVGDHRAVGRVPERSVAIVDEDPARAVVARHEEVRPPVIVDVGEVRGEAEVAD